MASDEELIGRIASKDEDAFKILLGRYESRLYNFALRMLRRSEDAEDVLQEVFLRVYRKAKTFKPKYRASTWLYTITRNACLDSLRKGSRTMTVSMAQPLGNSDGGKELTLQDTLEDNSPAPIEEAVEQELSDKVRDAVNCLPEPHRMVVVLREYEQLSCTEIAEVINCPVGTVKSRLHYAMEALRVKLRPLGREV